jgi:hypothetical protein
VAGRIFLLDNPRFTREVPPFLAANRSGLVLCGKDAGKKVAGIWRQSTIPLLADPAAYVNQAATPDEPFALPESAGTLVGSDLNSVLQGQRERHAAAAITPSRYVYAGDSPAFKALVRHAQAIEREDVIVAVPVALPWLTKTQYLHQLIAGLQRIQHPKALMFGSQNNPFDAPAAIVNFRLLLAETTNVGLWRADVLAAFDCMAYGGDFAGIGAGGSLRHLVPADERPSSKDPRAHTPAVLMPSMLRYSWGRLIADRYANTPAPSCACLVCQGASLNRFDSLSGEARATAHAHNAAVWTGWLPDLFDHATDAERRRWWRGFCTAAVDAHELENARLRRKGAFKPPAALTKLATLPLSGEAGEEG